MKTKELLEAVRDGSVSIEQAMEQLKTLPYENLGYARLDHHRELRTGFPEVIFSQGKTVEHTAAIFEKLYQFGKKCPALCFTKRPGPLPPE